MAQATLRFGFSLADLFSCDAQLPAYLLKRVRFSVDQAAAHLQYPHFARAKVLQDGVHSCSFRRWLPGGTSTAPEGYRNASDGP